MTIVWFMLRSEQLYRNTYFNSKKMFYNKT